MTDYPEIERGPRRIRISFPSADGSFITHVDCTLDCPVLRWDAEDGTIWSGPGDMLRYATDEEVRIHALLAMLKGYVKASRGQIAERMAQATRPRPAKP